MASARLATRHMQRWVSSPWAAALVRSGMGGRTGLKDERMEGCWGLNTARGLSEKASADKSETREVSVSEGDKKTKLWPSRRQRKGLWRKRGRDFASPLQEFLPSGLGNALMQAAESMNRVVEGIAPWRLMGRLKEKEECYKLRYELPGLAKEDLRITVEEGVLRIVGERRQAEEHEESEDESWYASSFGYCDATVVLPEDAKVEDITAEMKDGVLYVTIPRSPNQKKDVKEIEIN